MIFLRLLLAGIYIYAGGSKLLNLYLFKVTILAYYPFLGMAALLIAIVFPWLEILSGLALGVNWQGKYASTFLLLLSLFFLIQTLLNYSNVLPYGCGCFGFSGPEKITVYYVMRDSLIMLLSSIVCFREWKANKLPAEM
ncbi:MauE/DoxX family redox-associated membrane protein [Desulfosporosinus sp. FKA]|uniref:MauE/DoxX family redox-associated membrane protein n=1 Tax=Desulfosporosinus sp. FKA TaxID=1969834 RepID=UPI000B4A2371|nr:MauE/DoxX family redox-associated membrane protein [Desulfosporosinus sp. FKA]